MNLEKDDDRFSFDFHVLKTFFLLDAIFVGTSKESLYTKRAGGPEGGGGGGTMGLCDNSVMGYSVLEWMILQSASCTFSLFSSHISLA